MTTTSGSADKGTKQLLALARPQTANASGLSDVGGRHDASGLHLANGGQGANEVVGAHLGDTVFDVSQGEEFLEGEFTTLYELLDLGPAASIRHGGARGLDALFLRQ